MQTYVVRIFEPRRDDGELHGTVDEVSSGVSDTFHDAHQLLVILARSDGRGGAESMATNDQ